MPGIRPRAINANYWPGFVDALTTLLLVIIFLLVVFVLAQVVLSQAISGKDAALERLNQQVRELAELLDLERKASEELRGNAAQLSAALAESNRARDELTLLLEQMTARAAALEARADKAEQALRDADAKVAVGRETLEVQLRQLESLRRDIAALRQLRAELETEIAGLTTALEEGRTRTANLDKELEQQRQRVIDLREQNQALAKDLEKAESRVVVLSGSRDELAAERDAAQAQLGALRDRSKELEARLASEQERTLLAQKEIGAKDLRLAELLASHAAAEETIEQERALSAERRSQIALLNLQISRLREELQRLSALLDAAEEKDQKSQAVIKDLGQRLNRALAAKVEELSRYRSEFFGRLKEVLGERSDIAVVGDRFVFQSEVLFETGSDELGADGQHQLQQLAQTLNEIAAKIPPEINWVLRVDGHTDTRPIHTPRFPSNWELSTARAISVVRFLIGQGVPPGRLAATGFGEFQPLDGRADEVSFRRNRRIELKLTER